MTGGRCDQCVYLKAELIKYNIFKKQVKKTTNTDKYELINSMGTHVCVCINPQGLNWHIPDS